MRNKKIDNLENQGQGHGIRYLQWCHSMANIKIFQIHLTHFFALAHTSSDMLFKHFDLEDHEVQRV